MSKSEHVQERFVRTSVFSYIKNMTLIWTRSDFGLSRNHSVIYSNGVPRLPACQHRHLGYRRPQPGRKVDRTS